MTEHKKGVLAVVIAAMLWSTGGIFIKLVSLDAFSISFFRAVFASLVFLVLFRKLVLSVNPLAILNSFFYSGILILFVLATKMTTAANAIFLQFTAPLYVLILEPLILKTRFERINVLTVLLCFGGMLLFFVGDSTQGHTNGNILALLSGICFAGFLIGQRKNKSEYHQSSIFWGNLIIACVCLPLFVKSTAPLLTKDLAMVAYLGIVQIGLAYSIYSYSIKRIQAIEGALVSMIEPVLNPIWVFLGYGEVPSVAAIIGGVIILLTIATRAFFVEKMSRR